MSAGTLLVCDGCGESEFHAGTPDEARRHMAVELGWRVFQDTGCGEHVGTFEIGDYCGGCEAETDPEMQGEEPDVPGEWVRWLRDGLTEPWTVHAEGPWSQMTQIPQLDGPRAWSVLPKGRHPDDWKQSQ